MSNEQNQDKPAFPVVWDKTGEAIGLTKRELFAAMVMQGYCANHDFTHSDFDCVAGASVKQADALLTELAMHTPQANEPGHLENDN